jgi:hypothetical protein
MTDPIAMIMSLTGCSEKEASDAYDETEDVVDAVDKLLAHAPTNTPPPRKFVRTDKTPEEKRVEELRGTMKAIDEDIQRGINASHQPAGVVSTATPVLLEETVLQNNCLQECRLPLIEEGGGTLETVYQSPSECSSD